MGIECLYMQGLLIPHDHPHDPHDPMADRELWFSTTAQCLQRGLYPILLAQEKINIQNLKQFLLDTYCSHTIVKSRSQKLSHHTSGTICCSHTENKIWQRGFEANYLKARERTAMYRCVFSSISCATCPGNDHWASNHPRQPLLTCRRVFRSAFFWLQGSVYGEHCAAGR